VKCGALAVSAAVLVLGVACATSARDGFEEPEKKPEPGFVTDGGRADEPSGEVYGHSDTVLYVVDTKTHAVREIGPFQGCTHVADIALDESSAIYASTGAELFLIENGSGRCTRIATGTFPNSLSFVPAGTLEPGKETLVGYQGSAYVRIDPATGETTKVGELGGGFESSGDLVSVRDGKSFLTVKGPDCADCLVEFDPKTGALVKNWGPLGYADAYGLHGGRRSRPREARRRQARDHAAHGPERACGSRVSGCGLDDDRADGRREVNAARRRESLGRG